MKKLLSILFLFPLFANSTIYYFSNTGSDAAAGTSEGTAWQTITKFNSFFASLSVGDQCLFKRGDTFYGTLVISRSGSSGNVITIGAYGSGAKPIITGLSTVSAWTSLGSNIYESTSAVTIATTLNMVTFQGVLQPMGRWPKLNAADGGHLRYQTHSGNVSITSNAIASALSYVGGEVAIVKSPHILDRGVITAQTSTTVSYTQIPCPDHPGSAYDPIDLRGFFFQNHVNTCTVLGEWAFDPATKKIKMNFIGSTPASYTIKVAALDTLCVVWNKNYITFDNLQFVGSNFRTFDIHAATNIQINSCDFDLSGVDAIYVINSTSNNITVSGCTFNNTLNNVIKGNSSPNWIIQNNVFRNTTMIAGMAQSGDGQGFVTNNISDNSLVEYNQVLKSGYIGIHFIGNNTIIKNNFVDSFGIVKSDAGGIYTYGETTKTGRQIIGNIVLHGLGNIYGQNPDVLTNPYAGNEHGIYLDGGARNVTITGNTSAYHFYAGFHLGSSQGVTLRDNTSYDNQVTQITSIDVNYSLANIISKNNIYFARDSDQLISQYYLTTNYLATMGTIDSNFYCRPIWEPVSINTTGYSNYPTVPYHDGGIMNVYAGGPVYRFYSLDTWKTLSSQDAATVKTYATVTDASKIRFEYNATNATVAVSLGANTYYGVTGTAYSNSVDLPAYSSIILLNPVATGTPGGIIIKRKVRIY